MSSRLLAVRIREEQDVVVARQRARQLAGLLGFDGQDQVRIATAVSEIARNVYNYARGGLVEFALEGGTAPQILAVVVSDEGPGIADVPLILSGRYHSPTGMGLGIMGARRLMDQFAIESSPGKGTKVWLRKLLPGTAPLHGARDLARISDVLAREGLHDSLGEVQQQNQELLRVLEDLRRRQEDLIRLNRELEDTNRGVVALYAELDEKAEHLRRADEMKSRFLSNMSHEFRTPLNSILAISRLLQDHTDGALSEEQDKQVGFIRKGAQDLAEIVNDLLDLAKVEAGKIVVRPVEFEVENLFGALRGMLRPLLVTDTVRLVFEEAREMPPMYSDEGKISQVLRNFVSNALKFTEQGEIRVASRLEDDHRTIVFSVADTGIGIAAADQARIFQEFSQVDHPLQRKFKGTGLGLVLSRRLAELLGGRITLESAVGKGSTFFLSVPLLYRGLTPAQDLDPLDANDLDPARIPVLVVEDSPESLHVYERLLRGSPFQVVPARTLHEAERRRQAISPRAILLDIQLPAEEAWRYLARLKGTAETQAVPIVVMTSVDDHPKAAALGADACGVKPAERPWLLRTLRELTGTYATRAVVIDDDEAPRYALRTLLGQLEVSVTESTDPAEGLRRVREDVPDVLFLDLVMPGLSGFQILESLRSEARTRQLPVVVVTSKLVTSDEHDTLARLGATVMSKEVLGHHAALAEVRQALVTAGAPAPTPAPAAKGIA